MKKGRVLTVPVASRQGGPKASLDRILRAARLDPGLYAEVAADRKATGQALTVVALVALAHGLGGVIRGAYFGWNPASGFLFGVLGELSFFAVASFSIYLVARYVLGATVNYPQVLCPFGFSVLPGLLILIAALASLIGAEAPVFAVLIAWRLAAGFVAVRQALGIGAIKGGIALLVGTFSGAVAVAITSRALVEILRWFGVSG